MIRKTYTLVVLALLTFSARASSGDSSEPNLLESLKETQCQSAAQLGQSVVEKFFVENTKYSLPQQLEKVWSAQRSITRECLADFSIAAFETRERILMGLLFEGLLDIREDSSHLESFQNDFGKFLKEKQIVDFDFEKILGDDSVQTQVTDEFIHNAYQESADRRMALQVGRFVFTPKKRHNLFTVERWQKSVQTLIEATQNNAQEYLNWVPSLWFGEDAFVRGVLRKDHDDNLYNVKTRAAFSSLQMHMEMARSLGLDMDPFYKLQSTMRQKQFATLDRDIETIKAVRVGVAFAPLVPLGMAAGAGGLVYVGVSATTAANVAGATALGTSAVLTSIQFNRMKGQPGVTLGDRVFLPLVMSFPAAAVVPALVGGVPALGKYLFLEGAAFLRHLQVGYRYLRLNGGAGFAKALSATPKFLLRKWVAAWWKPGVGLDRSMLTIYLANNASTVIAEYVDRQYIKERAEDKFWVDGGINKKSLYRIVPSAIVGLVGAPLLTTKNFFERFIAWRLIDFAASSTMTFVVNKSVDKQYVTFEAIYGATGSTTLGEVDRLVSLAIKNSGMTMQHKFLLQTVYRLATVFPKTSLKNFFLDHYMRGDLKIDVAQFRKLIEKDMRLKLEGFSDEELLEAFESLSQDSDFLHALEQEYPDTQVSQQLPE